MSIHTILSQMEGELDKQVRPYFTTEYLICSDCKHAYESHYWNGGGSPEASGYDSCLVEGCKCKYAEKTETKTEYDEESINRFKSFFRSFATRIVEETANDICVLIDEVESTSQTNTLEEWKQYKHIRNAIRDKYCGTKLQKMKGEV